MKRYKVGGPTEYSESGSAGGSKVSFGEAFKSARKQGLDEFTWRGKKYTTEMKEEKSDSKADKPSVRKVSTKEFIENYEKSPASGRMRQEAYYKANPEPGLKAVDEEMFSPGVKIAGAAGAGAALGYGAKKLKDFLSRKGMERAGRKLAEEGIPSDAARAAASKVAKERRASSPARREREYDERLASDMAGGYKRGGSVKSSASRRADGIASRGKTRGKFI